VQASIHIAGSKKKGHIFLVSFGNHQYEVSGDFKEN